MAKKKRDIDAAKASKMTPAQILKELKRGKTISGYSDYLDAHFGEGMVRDVREKDIKNLEKKYGSVWFAGTVKTKPGGGIADTARELFGRGYRQPPKGRSSWW